METKSSYSIQKWPRPKEKVVLITPYLHHQSKWEGEPFHITYLASNGVYEKDENKQMRVDGLDNARMLLHTCTTHSQGVGFNSKHEDFPVSRPRCAYSAADLNFPSPLALLVWALPSRAWCWHHDVGSQHVTNPFSTLKHTHLCENQHNFSENG